MPPISQKAINLILEFEGFDQPSKWPGEQSGITIGVGYDLGYVDVDQFEKDWSKVLDKDTIEKLKPAIGVKGIKAKELASKFVGIKISKKAAISVFEEKTLPEYQKQASEAFPGFYNLPLNAQGALISLVYNRGTAMNDNSHDDRRREMRAIKEAVSQNDLKEIANQLRSMKRLWIGRGEDGLLRRRDAE